MLSFIKINFHFFSIYEYVLDCFPLLPLGLFHCIISGPFHTYTHTLSLSESITPNCILSNVEKKSIDRIYHDTDDGNSNCYTVRHGWMERKRFNNSQALSTWTWRLI